MSTDNLLTDVWVSSNEDATEVVPVQTLHNIYDAICTPSEFVNQTKEMSLNIAESVLGMIGFAIRGIEYSNENGETTLLYRMYETETENHFRLKFNILDGTMTIQVPERTQSYYTSTLRSVSYITDFLPITDYDMSTGNFDMVTGEDVE